MQEVRRPRVFVSYTLTDDDGRAIHQALASRFDTEASETLTGNVARRTALRQMLTQTDVVVVILPPTDDPSWINVVFEAGVVVGTGTPLVLIGDVGSAPVDLAESLVFGRDQINNVIDAIEELTESKRKQQEQDVGLTDQGTAIEHLRVDITLSPDWVNNWMARLDQVKDERSALRLVAELFEQAGARTRPGETKSGRIVDAPDLVIWHDDLLAAFGLPLPVEILMQTRAWPTVRSRLERTLTASGGRTLFAVIVRGELAPSVWTDGRRRILVSTARDLSYQLIRLPLAQALSTLLIAATP